MFTSMPGLFKTITAMHPKGRGTTIIAIDGCGGSGKSTLAKLLASRVPGTTVVSTDDFARPRVLGWEWERMKAQVLDPLNRSRPGKYQRYDWPSDTMANGTAFRSEAS